MNNKSFIPPPVTLPPGSIVIAYVRDSGRPGQKNNRDQQQRIITDYCKQHGLVLRKVYSETVCGKSKGRIQFSEMVKMIRTSTVDTRPLGLLLWNYSRFCRDAAHFTYLFGLQLKGMIVHSLTEEVPGIIDSPILSPIKGVAYLRDNGGPDQKSRDQQHRIITDYCQQHGLDLSKVYSEAASERQ
jgi:DNA invertase Pin-like site-specific DNA recombinase